MSDYIDVVFDKLPGPDGCVFIETEDADGRGIGGVGEWVEREDGFAVLRIPDPRLVAALRHERDELRRELDVLQRERLADVVDDAQAAPAPPAEAGEGS